MRPSARPPTDGCAANDWCRDKGSAGGSADTAAAAFGRRPPPGREATENWASRSLLAVASGSWPARSACKRASRRIGTYARGVTRTFDRQRPFTCMACRGHRLNSLNRNSPGREFLKIRKNRLKGTKIRSGWTQHVRGAPRDLQKSPQRGGHWRWMELDKLGESMQEVAHLLTALYVGGSRGRCVSHGLAWLVWLDKLCVTWLRACDSNVWFSE